MRVGGVNPWLDQTFALVLYHASHQLFESESCQFHELLSLIHFHFLGILLSTAFTR
jgi:hypothetical protein